MKKFFVGLVFVFALISTRCTLDVEYVESPDSSYTNSHGISYVELYLGYECLEEPYWDYPEWCDYFGDSTCCTWYVGYGCHEEWCDWAGHDCWEYELQWCEY